MSLVTCLQRANKGKRVFASAEIQELQALAAKNRETMPAAEAEAAAVQSLLDEAIAEQAEVRSLILEAAPALGAKAEAKPVEVKAEKPAEAPAAAEKIEDFGQKLEGARKDYAAVLKDAESIDTATEPLSKSWPEPDYQKLLAGGADPYMVAFAHAARDELPTKPQKAWKLKGWVQQAEMLRRLSQQLFSGVVTPDRMREMLASKEFQILRKNVGSRAELYQLVGHDRSLKGITFAENHFSLYHGQENVRKWVVEQKAKATMFSNWPRELAVADTKAEMLEIFKAKMLAAPESAAKAKASFIIWREASEYHVGKKLGKNYVTLKKFADVKAARAYIAEHAAELESALEKYKATPFERKTENDPRVGDDHRAGGHATPEAFDEAFKFRGVQFGNWVEQGKRQNDLDQGYDSLMDLAAVLGIPTRSLSLNGQLGLAFGSQGRGGKNAAAAHYNPATVVINLTKEHGAGSLAHEWLHSVDNYFAKLGGGKGGMMTDGAINPAVRPEMVDAFKGIQKAIMASDMRKRSRELDKRRSEPYWSTYDEMAARAFEAYIVAKLQDQNAANDYLANIVSENYWKAQEALMGHEGEANTYPYPTQAEMGLIREAFDHFFKTVETREDDAGNVAMFSRAPQTNTAAFKKWFGASKVVDAQGEPLVVYHGTLGDFDTFDTTGIEGGAFFTADPKVAAGFARWNWESGGEGEQTVMPVHLSIKNPKRIAASEVMPDGEHSFEGMIAAIKKAKREGYDGLHIPSTPDMGAVADQWVAFSPEQIKSATGNNGDFDANNPDITYSRNANTRLGIPMRDATAVAQAIREALPTAPQILVHESLAQAPQKLQDAINAAGAANDVEAAYHDGAIHVFPQHMASVERMAFVVGHHEIRHHGLRSMLGPRLGPVLLGMHQGNANLRAAAQAKIDEGLTTSRVEAIEEALADMPLEELAKLNGWDKIVTAVRQWLRNLAAKLRRTMPNLADAIDPMSWTDRDVAAMVMRAENVSRGGSGGFRTGGTVFSQDAEQAQISAMQSAADQYGDADPAEAEKVERALTGKTLKQAAAWLAKNAPPELAPIAESALKQISRLELAGAAFTFKIAHKGDMVPMMLTQSRGITSYMFGPKDGKGKIDVWLNGADLTGKVGVSYQTAVHELVHAATMAATRIGNFKSQAGTPLAQHVADLYAVTNHIRAEFNRRIDEHRAGRRTLSEFESKVFARQNNAFADANETIAWALTSPGAQEFLESIQYKSKSAWTAFVAAIRKVLGLNPSADTALSEVLRVSDLLMQDDAHTLTEALASSDGNDMRIQQAMDSTMLPQTSQTQAMFSRTTAGTAKLTAQDLVNSTGGVFDFNRMGENKQDRLRTVMDGSRPFWLGALTRDQIADIYGKDISPVKEYDQLTRDMENQRSKIAQDADDIYSEWAKLPAEENDKLARMMLDATVYSVHPDGAFNATGAPNDAERRQVHARLKAQYALMGKDAKAMYGKVRDFHLSTLTQLRDGLLARVDRQVENGAAKGAALTKIRQAFDAYLKEGPYFPLSRFGDFLVIANRAEDGERVVASYATAGEQAAAARTLEADGFTVKMKTAKTYSRETDGSAGKFIGDVLTTLDKLDMADATVGGDVADLKTKLMDDVNQLFIKALPDLSYRKHFMHRKGTPGFSSDMMRGFASSSFHAASHIARLNHGDKMTFALQDAYSAIEQVSEGDFNLHSQVLNELTKRHDAALNPNTHPIASMLNQVGFVMYLGMSPAAGIINMLQTVMVTMPHLGARYGFGKANGSLAKALSDITTGAKANAKNGWNAAQSTKLTAAERSMMSALQDEGVIDLTQAHDLASATGLDTGNVARSKAAFAMARSMKIVGWTFHIPEVMNRQVTALSAYRLEMEKSGNEDAAKEAAREAIKRTHFDYSASNRARFMQGNVARVMLQFKQYGQNMTYLLGRAAYQALKGESPEVRSIARRQLVATFGVTWAMAGTLGLPGIGSIAGLIGALVGAMDDDDEPWDWKVEFRNLMADQFGKEAGEVISHGIPRALMPWDISNRVSLGDLWWRDNGREGQNPREAFASDMSNILGPTAGTVLGLYTAADHMAKGNWSKATEAMVPKFLRDPLKALREGTEGVTSYAGEPLMDTTAAETMGRLLGFAPARASEMFEGKNAVMNAKTAIEQKRQALIGQMAKARIDKDTETAAELQPEIAAFNQRNPEFRITGATIAKATMTRMKNRRNTEDGILLPRTKQSLRDIGRFAEVD